MSEQKFNPPRPSLGYPLPIYQFKIFTKKNRWNFLEGIRPIYYEIAMVVYSSLEN